MPEVETAPARSEKRREYSPTVSPAQAVQAAEPVEQTLPRFLVTWREVSTEVEAANEREAWSKFCDTVLHKYPPPKTGSVKPI